ncbi:MAG: GvpL/GvpF family gas vesicle protein, partial [Planctomycetota bacterium]
PSGFGSVFTTREALASRVASCAEHAAEYFDLVRGSHEWSLRIYADRATIKRAVQPTKASEATSGADYLRKKQGRSSLDAALEQRALALVDTALDALEPTTVDIAERPVLETDENEGWQIAHIALLIDKTNQGSFDEALDQVAETLEPLGLRFTLSGPWPSYSFCPRVGDGADAPGLEHST